MKTFFPERVKAEGRGRRDLTTKAKDSQSTDISPRFSVWYSCTVSPENIGRVKFKITHSQNYYFGQNSVELRRLI